MNNSFLQKQFYNSGKIKLTKSIPIPIPIPIKTSIQFPNICFKNRKYYCAIRTIKLSDVVPISSAITSGYTISGALEKRNVFSFVEIQKTLDRSKWINQRRSFSVFRFLRKNEKNEKNEGSDVLQTREADIKVETEKVMKQNEERTINEEKGLNMDMGMNTNIDIDVDINKDTNKDINIDINIDINKDTNTDTNTDTEMNVGVRDNMCEQIYEEGKGEKGLGETCFSESESSYIHFLIEKCRENSKNEIEDYEGSWYVEIIYELLQAMKLMLDCSWMSSIILTTIFMRVIILPLTISAERDRRKQAILNPLIRDLTEKLKSNAQEGNIKKAMEYKQRILNVRNTHGISLIPKSIILMTFFQTPLFCIFYFSMKKIASFPHVFKEFTFESPLWLDSLSLPDPYYILPFLSSLLLLSNNELTSLLEKQMNTQQRHFEETEFQKNVKKFTKIGMRLFYISSFFFFKSMPSGLFIYFVTNTFFQLIVTQICKIRVVERFLDLPPMQSKGFNFLEKQEKSSLGKKKKVIHMNELLYKMK